MNATTIRWVGDLANYNFNVKYRPGKLSTDCDYLPRHPVDITSFMDQCNEEITSDAIGAIVTGSKQKGKFAAFNSVMVPEFGKLAISQLSPHDVRAEQKKDDILGDIIRWVENRKYPDKETKKQMNRKKVLLNQWKKLEINKNGILVRKTKQSG